MNRVIACGVVLYETPERDVRRLARSVKTAASVAGVANLRFLSIDNSGRYTSASYAEAVDGVLPAELAPGRGNLGFGRGHNCLMQGAFQEGASHYLALNPDGFLHPEALRALLRLSARHHDFALVEARQFPQEHPKAYDFQTFVTPWCSGACVLAPKRLYAEIGGFDEGFFMYCEDVDYSWRARAAGAPCLIAPDAYFLHDVVDRPQSDFARWHMALSMRRLLSKWHAKAAPPRLIALLDEMLADAPEEALRQGSAPAAVQFATVGNDVADFSNSFGFAPFRWN